MLTSVERDGSLMGYDVALCRRVVDAVSIPVLIAGGAGNWQHFVDGVIEGGAEAVCTTNVYHFTAAAVQSAKARMAEAGIPVRA
jgi:cyclase